MLPAVSKLLRILYGFIFEMFVALITFFGIILKFQVFVMTISPIFFLQNAIVSDACAGYKLAMVLMPTVC